MNIRDIRLNELNDAELDILSGLVHAELEERARLRAKAGDFPEPTDQEKVWYVSGQRVKAVLEYRKRCFDFEPVKPTLIQAEMVFEALVSSAANNCPDGCDHKHNPNCVLSCYED